MNRSIGLALLAVGILLMVFGIRASDSIVSDISRLFTGAPSEKSIWLLLAGIVATVIGVALSFKRRVA